MRNYCTPMAIELLFLEQTNFGYGDEHFNNNVSGCNEPVYIAHVKHQSVNCTNCMFLSEE